MSGKTSAGQKLYAQKPVNAKVAPVGVVPKSTASPLGESPPRGPPSSSTRLLLNRTFLVLLSASGILGGYLLLRGKSRRQPLKDQQEDEGEGARVNAAPPSPSPPPPTTVASRDGDGSRPGQQDLRPLAAVGPTAVPVPASSALGGSHPHPPSPLEVVLVRSAEAALPLIGSVTAGGVASGGMTAGILKDNPLAAAPGAAAPRAAATAMTTPGASAVQPRATATSGLSADDKRRVLQWVLEEKRKVKAADARQKREIDAQKQLLKDFIRGKLPLESLA